MLGYNAHHQTVPLAALTQRLLHDLRKMRHFFNLPFYVLFTALLVTTLCVHRVHFRASHAQLYFQESAMRLLQAERFLAIRNRTDFFPWLEASVVSAVRGAASVEVMDVINVRQVRSRRDACTGRHLLLIDPVTRGEMLSSGCVFVPDGQALVPFGNYSLDEGATWQQFLPTSMQPDALQTFRHVARFHTLSDPSNEYSFVIGLENDAENSTRGLRALAEGEWFDDLTSAVAVDAVVKFAVDEVFVVASFIVEVTASGYFGLTPQSDAFRFFVSSRGVIFLDVLIVLMFFVLLAFGVGEIYENYTTTIDMPRRTLRNKVRVAASILGFWEVYTVGLLLSVLTVVSLRMDLWNTSITSVATVRGREAFNLCVRANAMYARIYDLYCVCLVLVAFRLFYTFRYLAGLSMITNTMRRSAQDLLKIGVVFLCLLVVFSITGSMLYGQSVEGMRTFPQTFVFLMKALVSAELPDEDYRAMLQVQAIMTDTYLVALFLLFWLVLLNLVIATISSAFLSSRGDDSDAESIRDVLETYLFFVSPMYSVDRLANEAGVHPSGMAASSRLASAALSVRLPFRQRLVLLARLRMWRYRSYMTVKMETETREAGDRQMSLTDLQKLLQAHEDLLSTNHLNGPDLAQKVYVAVMHARGVVVHSANETSDQHLRLQRHIQHMRNRVARAKTALDAAKEQPKSAPPSRPRSRVSSFTSALQTSTSLHRGPTAEPTRVFDDVAHNISSDDSSVVSDAEPVHAVEDLQPAKTVVFAASVHAVSAPQTPASTTPSRTPARRSPVEAAMHADRQVASRCDPEHDHVLDLILADVADEANRSDTPPTASMTMQRPTNMPDGRGGTAVASRVAVEPEELPLHDDVVALIDTL